MITEQEQILTGHTKTAQAYNQLNFDDILYPHNIIDTESYINVGEVKHPCHIEGYVLSKSHENEHKERLYFVRTQDYYDLPLRVNQTRKVHYKGKVYYLVTDKTSFKIVPENILGWRGLVDFSFLPSSCHTNPDHYILYKNKRWFSRLHDQVYARIISESGFGKDKFPTWYRHLVGEFYNLKSPSAPKLYFAACHSKEIQCNEVSSPKADDYSAIKNMMLAIAENADVIDKPTRGGKGTTESTDTSKLSMIYTHNPPEYYHKLGKKSWEDIWTYELVNRLYYNQYEGFLNVKFPRFDKKEIAMKYQDFFKAIIKTAKWYENNWNKLKNMYPGISLNEYKFREKEERYKWHFRDFAKCLSHYAKTESEYKCMLQSEYQSHKNYDYKLNGLE